uniref:Ion transport domain-containing protein n=1 Tax=Timspurckia oligopyrenoides TaxID=708627 RepID=A0A7S0ZJN2_9RHOD|mmetsp:Transcript_7761/g.14086  ORF Transcript_7761/g.14086 Transcript_7761/m.14086 type:complete len:379 (+) Transcript_7761:54-1190(+)
MQCGTKSGTESNALSIVAFCGVCHTQAKIQSHGFHSQCTIRYRVKFTERYHTAQYPKRSIALWASPKDRFSSSSPSSTEAQRDQKVIEDISTDEPNAVAESKLFLLPFVKEVQVFVTSTVLEEFVCVLVLVTCLCFQLESVESIQMNAQLYSFILNTDKLISAFFVVEYVLRLYSCQLNPKLLFQRPMFIDFISILPLFSDIANLQFLRLFRLIRILRIQRLISASNNDRQAEGNLSRLPSSKLRATEIVVTVFSLIYITSALVFEAEHTANPAQFGNMFDALYYSVVTLTTLGFGDLAPVTSMGRFVTSVSILTGVFLIPYQLGLLANSLLGEVDFKSVISSNQPTISSDVFCSNCKLTGHSSDAAYCRRCGFRLFM